MAAGDEKDLRAREQPLNKQCYCTPVLHNSRCRSGAWHFTRSNPSNTQQLAPNSSVRTQAALLRLQGASQGRCCRGTAACRLLQHLQAAKHSRLPSRMKNGWQMHAACCQQGLL